MNNSAFLKAVGLGVLTAAFSGPVSAGLIFSPSLTQTGTGLGAVPTVVTVLDAGDTGNGIESGCVSATVGNPPAPSFACELGLQGGDNQAINNLITASDLPGVTSASQLALVVNLNEEGNDGTALLTNLYLGVYNATTGALIGTHAFTDSDGFELQQVSGIGGAGSVFTLDATQQDEINLQCLVLSECLFGAGIQFAEGSTSGGLETVFLSFVSGNGTLPPGQQVAEPATLALLGLSLVGLAGLRRKLS